MLALVPNLADGALRQLERWRKQLEAERRREHLGHTTVERREQVLHDFYRAELKRLVPELLEKWQPRLGVEARAWGIKRMKTKWGTCNIDARRIWLNLELAKKPVQCLEYILVHELAHLHERHHNERFTALLDENLPHWRLLREELNQSMLAEY